MPAHKTLSPAEWVQIVVAYQRGEKNLRELAAEFGVSWQAIQKGLKARGVEKGSALEEVAQETQDAAREAREAKVKTANQAVDNYAKWFDVLAKMTMKKVIEAESQSRLPTINADVLVLKNAIAIVEKARNENWEILGIENLLGENAELPDLNVGEYTPEELEAIRSANEEAYQQTLHDEAGEFAEPEE